jgi:pyocin large subunit-like protein
MQFRREHGIGAGVLAIIVAVAFVYFMSPVRFAAPTAPGATAPAVTSDAGWNAPVWTGGEDNAQHHWEKHGAEFPQFASEQAYVAGVHAFLMHPPTGTLVKHRSNGDTLYFDPASGTFAVQARNGAPRTFFKPDNGMDYWNRQ